MLKLSNGETHSVFQLEGSGMTRYVKELKPQTVRHLAAMVALYRPGPMAHIPNYIARKDERQAVEYPDPSLEDILEEIVGDISDEHDVVVAGVRAQSDGSVVVDGSVPIRDLNRVMNWDLPDEEAVTVAGLVIHEAQAIPDPGQRFAFHGYRFQVLRRQRNQITALRVEREVEEELEGG